MTPEKDEVRETPRTDAVLTTDDGTKIVLHGTVLTRLVNLVRELEREVQDLGDALDEAGRQLVKAEASLKAAEQRVAELEHLQKANEGRVKQIVDEELLERAERAEASLKAAQTELADLKQIRATLQETSHFYEQRALETGQARNYADNLKTRLLRYESVEAPPWAMKGSP